MTALNLFCASVMDVNRQSLGIPPLSLSLGDFPTVQYLWLPRFLNSSKQKDWIFSRVPLLLCHYVHCTQSQVKNVEGWALTRKAPCFLSSKRMCMPPATPPSSVCQLLLSFQFLQVVSICFVSRFYSRFLQGGGEVLWKGLEAEVFLFLSY